MRVMCKLSYCNIIQINCKCGYVGVDGLKFLFAIIKVYLNMNKKSLASIQKDRAKDFG